ncbi:hypothetical protein CBP27_01740 [Fischerella thermalis WC542]|nr:hypothetical protein CBP28_19720 [Fischerella thermalis WC559]PLZ28582.1 hypothetical protein CBP29_01645 [Fischerella thermalis WC341]PLZ44596.1 hypothetical protein CBP27_01740 [Fischerella thermalis WC542]
MERWGGGKCEKYEECVDAQAVRQRGLPFGKPLARLWGSSPNPKGDSGPRIPHERLRSRSVPEGTTQRASRKGGVWGVGVGNYQQLTTNH